MKFLKNIFTSFCTKVVIIFSIIGCTKTCVGGPELGSDRRPIRFYVDISERGEGEEFHTKSLTDISKCLERAIHYNISFDASSQGSAVTSAIAKGEWEFGVIGLMDLLQSAEIVHLKPVLTTQSKSPGRIVLFVNDTSAVYDSTAQNTSLWNILAASKFAYTQNMHSSPIVLYFLKYSNIFPKEMLIVDDEKSVLHAVKNNLAMAGAVSEQLFVDFHKLKFPLKPNSSIQGFKILKISPKLPKKIIISREELPKKITHDIAQGLKQCAQQKNLRDAILEVFEDYQFSETFEEDFKELKAIVTPEN